MLILGILLAVQILLLATSQLCATPNYCDPELCITEQQIKNHIACKNDGKFASTCEEPSVIQVTSQFQQAILYAHNDLRNKVANGSLAGFQTAERMTTMTWDDELEYLAVLNVLRCELERDECHNTVEYKFSGQNLAIQYQSGVISPADYESIIIFLINEWFNEYRHANQGDLDRCTRNSLARGIGHFTAMIQERSSKIGCGIAKFIKRIQGRRWSTILMACNYSFDNLINWPVYVKGPKCSACLTGENPSFNGLCSINEPVPIINELHESRLWIPSDRYIQLVPSPASEIPIEISLNRLRIPISQSNSIIATDRSSRQLISPPQSIETLLLPTSIAATSRPQLLTTVSLSIPAASRPQSLTTGSLPITTVSPLKSIAAILPADSPTKLSAVVSPFASPKQSITTLPPRPNLSIESHRSSIRVLIVPPTRYNEKPPSASQAQTNQVQPVRRYNRASRQIPVSSFRELIQPILPIPRPIAWIKDKLRVVASWFIFP